MAIQHFYKHSIRNFWLHELTFFMRKSVSEKTTLKSEQHIFNFQMLISEEKCFQLVNVKCFCHLKELHFMPRQDTGNTRTRIFNPTLLKGHTHISFVLLYGWWLAQRYVVILNMKLLEMSKQTCITVGDN